MIIFAKTRHHYDSYRDFFRLVETAGFPTCFVDQIDLSQPDIFVFTPMNGEVIPHLQSQAGRQRRARVVWWNLERPQDETLFNSIDKLQSLIDDIWVSDRTYAKLDARFTYVQLAGMKGYGTISAERDWDICTLSYLWGRRLDLVNKLSARYHITPQAWNKGEQDKFVAKSHLMLNMHQYENMRTIAPIRFAVAASYAIPIISESFDDALTQTLVIGSYPYDHLETQIDRLFIDKDRLAEEGEVLYQRLCIDTDFRREVAKAP